MDIILIPGLWLDGSSWDEVVPTLEQAGHRPHPLTLPGMESKDTDRSEITLRDHVDAVVEVIDSFDPAEGKVVLVGHSGGGAIAHAAVDALPAAFRERAIPSPQHVARDRQRLSDERRYDVPVTVIACEFSGAMLRKLMEEGHPYMQELAKTRDVEY